MEEGIDFCDICVVCALPEEVKAFLEVIRPYSKDLIQERVSSHYNYSYRFATIMNDKDEPLRLHISWLPRYGPHEMTLHLSRVLEECQPRIAIMTGICAGDSRQVHLGDLVVAERAFTYDNGKFTLDDHGNKIHQHDTLTYQLDANILQFLGLFENWKPLVAGLTPPLSLPQPPQTVCHLKAIASGSAVRMDHPFEDVQAPVRGTVAIDMEGAAFGLVMNRYPLIRWLIVKGVCDYVDRNKHDTYHDYAAHASALYALCFIRAYVTTERLPRSERPLSSSRVGPSPIWNIPYPRNPFFLGRESELTQTCQQLEAGQTIAFSQPQAISGLGGIGKTQTAVEFAYRYRQNYQAVLWLQADSRDILFAQFAQLTQILNLPEGNGQDQAWAVRVVRDWLKDHNKWLLILDNIEDLHLVEELLPPDHRGCILLTTRAHVTEPIAHANELQAMTEQEGMLFLLRRSKTLTRDMPLEAVLEDDHITAKKIWRLMDGLPLALDQAGAYILETGCGLQRYLDLFQRRHIELLKRRGGFSSSHPASVSTTFFLTFEKIEAQHRATADLLKFCAFLQPEAIPEELLTEGANAFDSDLQAVATDPLRLDKAIEVLRKYSLIHRDPRAKTLTMHVLVQTVLRGEMDENASATWANYVVLAIHQALVSIVNQPSPPPHILLKAKWMERQRYLPHMQVCTRLIEQWDMQFIEATHLLHATADYIQFNAPEKKEEAERLYRKALAMWEKIPGAEDDVANCLNSLAIHYLTCGKYEEAELLCQRAIAIYEQLQGSESPQVVKMLEFQSLLLQHQIALLAQTDREDELAMLKARIQDIRSRASL